MYFRKINPNTTFLYSAASIFFLKRSAVLNNDASKLLLPFAIPFLFGLLGFSHIDQAQLRTSRAAGWPSAAAPGSAYFLDCHTDGLLR
jgi:hypothetical protein